MAFGSGFVLPCIWLYSLNPHCAELKSVFVQDVPSLVRVGNTRHPVVETNAIQPTGYKFHLTPDRHKKLTS